MRTDLRERNTSGLRTLVDMLGMKLRGAQPKPKLDEHGEAFKTVPNRNDLRQLGGIKRPPQMGRLGTRVKGTPASLYTHTSIPLTRADGSIRRVVVPRSMVENKDE